MEQGRETQDPRRATQHHTVRKEQGQSGSQVHTEPGRGLEHDQENFRPQLQIGHCQHTVGTKVVCPFYRTKIAVFNIHLSPMFFFQRDQY